MKRGDLFKVAVSIMGFCFLMFGKSSGVCAQTLQWTSKANLPLVSPPVIGGSNAMCFAINGKIYVGGGYIASFTNSREFYEYDTMTNAWTQKADLPGGLNRSAGVAFAAGGKGYIGLGAENYLDISGGAILKADMWEYNPALDTWITKAPLPDSGRANASCFVINSKAYVVGGEITAGGFTTADVWEYDPATNSWNAKAPFPAGTVKNAFAFSLGTGTEVRGYISCGSVNSAGSVKTYAYDAVSNSWAVKADYPGSKVRAGMAFTMNGKAYCGAGLLSFTEYTDTFYAYEPVAGTWGSAITNFPATPRAYGISASYGNKAFLGAGWTYASSGETFYRDWYRVVDTSAATGIAKNIGVEGLKVYPNPANGTLNITIGNGSASTGTVVLFNLVGRQLIATNWLKGSPVDISLLPAGNYLVRLETKENVYYDKIVVQK
jgi:N-acetylneuraminic acid mutarotase